MNPASDHQIKKIMVVVGATLFGLPLAALPNIWALLALMRDFNYLQNYFFETGQQLSGKFRVFLDLLKVLPDSNCCP